MSACSVCGKLSGTRVGDRWYCEEHRPEKAETQKTTGYRTPKEMAEFLSDRAFHWPDDEELLRELLADWAVSVMEEVDRRGDRIGRETRDRAYGYARAIRQMIEELKAGKK